MMEYENGKKRKVRNRQQQPKAQLLSQRYLSRYALMPHGQNDETETVCMETKLDRLRLLTRRMTGKNLDGLSFSELQLLDSRLQDVLVIVQNQKGKVKLEQCLQEKVKMDGYERMSKQKKQDEMARELSAPCKSSRTSSSEERPQKQDDEAPLLPSTQREFERRNAESMQSEFDRLWLLNERMNGRELDGMTYFELLLLEGLILKAINSVKDEKLGPRMELMARHLKEESLSPLAEQLDTVKDDHHRHISSRFRSRPTPLSVSRKLKRFRFRHRKTMPYIRSV